MESQEVERALDASAASRRGSSTEAPPSLMLIYIALNIAVILTEEHVAKAKQRGYDHPWWHFFSTAKKKKSSVLFIEWRNFGLKAEEPMQGWIRGHVKQSHTRTIWKKEKC